MSWLMSPSGDDEEGTEAKPWSIAAWKMCSRSDKAGACVVVLSEAVLVRPLVYFGQW